MTEVEIPLARTPYTAFVGEGILGRCGELAAKKIRPGRCAIVTDSNVGPLHGIALEAGLRVAGFLPETLTVPAGEASKSMSQADRVCEAMAQAGLDRSSSVFALGGGVVGDLAGFVAAIYYRGIPCVQVPTTVVAQVDSSIGGKTGVNLAAGKNLVGSFHQPALVVADVSTLSTLPPREFHEGFAEIIKHAAIRDPELLGEIADRTELVARNIRIKASIVAADEFETSGLRALLNFGHTIGHGIETAAGYGSLLHGEAISLGLAAAAALSVKHAGLPQSEADRIIKALARHNLPLKLPREISTESILAAVSRDKKFQSGAVRFVLLKKLGEAFVSEKIPISEIRSAIEELR
jgi:3-dehydroquinate synthase